MLDHRAQTLLKVLIERYIADGQPVGSRTLSRYSGLELSPATIRNVMADLEEMGFVSSPHTSAGRIPTPKGYRLFVDTLLTVKPLQPTEADAMQNKLQKVQPQKTLTMAAQVLSNLSQFAGVVLIPRRSAIFKQVDFLRLSEKRVLLIIVTPEGDVQNRILLMCQDYSPSQLTEAGNFLNQNYAGMSFEDVRTRLRSELMELRDNMTQLMHAAIDAGSEAMAEPLEQPVVIAGERNLLGMSDLSSSMDSMRKLFDLFEQKTQLMQLLEATSKAAGIQIFIGGESEFLPVDDLSAVTAPYEVDGQIMGTLGVIGPTRMAYERVIPIVDITAKLLSNVLTRHEP